MALKRAELVTIPYTVAAKVPITPKGTRSSTRAKSKAIPSRAVRTIMPR